jgi:hypothetical protein
MVFLAAYVVRVSIGYVINSSTIISNSSCSIRDTPTAGRRACFRGRSPEIASWDGWKDGGVNCWASKCFRIIQYTLQFNHFRKTPICITSSSSRLAISTIGKSPIHRIRTIQLFPFKISKCIGYYAIIYSIAI